MSQPGRRNRLLVGWGGWGLALCLAAGAAPPTNARMRDLVQAVVGSEGSPMIMIGSWVSGARYRDPLLGGTSDHDLRLLVPPGTNNQEALRRWNDVRGRLQAAVRKEFGNDAEKVLRTVNLYPPEQLMHGVEDATDAAVRFRNLGSVPRLSHSGPPPAVVTEEVAEGLYGPGSQMWVRQYERDSGRLIYRVQQVGADGKPMARVMSGLPQVVHAAGGDSPYTVAGMANTSLQWCDHAERALADGDAAQLRKYLARLERDFVKARSLAKAELTGPWREELRALQKALAEPGNLGVVRGRVEAALGRSRLSSSILSMVTRQNEARNAVAVKLLQQAENEQGALRRLLTQASEKVPLETVLNGMMLLWTTVEVSRGAGEGDGGRVMVGLAGALGVVSPGLLTALANEVLNASRDAGFDMVAGRQGAFDLLEGIYTAGGRPDANGKTYTIDQLVRHYREGDEERLRTFVYGLCTLAAARQAGVATGAADARVADALLARCYPVIRNAWRARRLELMDEFLELRDSYLKKEVCLTYQPVPVPLVPPKRVADVVLKIAPLHGKFADELTRMRAILDLLYGTGNYYVKVEDRWMPRGTEAAQENQRAFKLGPDGRYTVELRRTLSVGVTKAPTGCPVVGESRLETSVDVEIGTGLFATVLPPETKADVPLKPTFTALVERVPPTLTKLGYSWSFGDDYDKAGKLIVPPVQVCPGPYTPTLTLPPATLTFPRFGNDWVKLKLYDLSHGPYTPTMPPLATASRSVSLAPALFPAKYNLRFELAARSNRDNTAAMPGDWDEPSFAVTVPITVDATGGFTVARTWVYHFGEEFGLGERPINTWQQTVTGTGKIGADGVLTLQGTFARARKYHSLVFGRDAECDYAQSDTAAYRIQAKLTSGTEVRVDSLPGSGTFDSRMSITPTRPAGPTVDSACAGALSASGSCVRWLVWAK